MDTHTYKLAVREEGRLWRKRYMVSVYDPEVEVWPWEYVDTAGGFRSYEEARQAGVRIAHEHHEQSKRPGEVVVDRYETYVIEE